MIEQMAENAPVILGFIVLLGGTIWGIFKYNKKKIRDAYNDGVLETNGINKIEKKADKALLGVSNLEKKLKEEQESADEHHKRLYDKIDIISKDVSFIRGKLE